MPAVAERLDDSGYDDFVRAIAPVSPPKYAPPSALRCRRASRMLAPNPSEVLDELLERVTRQLIVPAIQASSRKEYLDIVHREFVGYLDVETAAKVILETLGPGTQIPDDDALCAELREYGRNAAGDAAADEVVFSMKTYLSAIGLTKRLTSAAAEEHQEQDRTLAESFFVNSALHQIGVWALQVIGSGHDATEKGIETTFELMRGGALRAFVAAREALDLRTDASNETDTDQALFDEEDEHLAQFC